MSALASLDLVAAADLLYTGSERLRPVADEIRTLWRVAFGRPTPADRPWLAEHGLPVAVAGGDQKMLRLLLRARLRLVETLADADTGMDAKDPWGCVVRAAAAGEAVLGTRGKQSWSSLHGEPPHATKRISEYRNMSNFAHRDDEKRRTPETSRGPLPKTPTSNELHDWLRDARKTLSRVARRRWGLELSSEWDDVLVRCHAELCEAVSILATRRTK